MNGTTDALLIALVGVLGTLSAPVVSQRLSASARREEFALQRLPVTSGLSEAYRATMALDEGHPQPGWSFEETRDFLQELWEEWRHLRAGHARRSWSPGLNLRRMSRGEHW